MIEQIIREFPITVYGNLTKYSDTISKGRCRIEMVLILRMNLLRNY